MFKNVDGFVLLALFACMINGGIAIEYFVSGDVGGGVAYAFCWVMWLVCANFGLFMNRG